MIRFCGHEWEKADIETRADTRTGADTEIWIETKTKTKTRREREKDQVGQINAPVAFAGNCAPVGPWGGENSQVGAHAQP